jgi:signal peptidase II
MWRGKEKKGFMLSKLRKTGLVWVWIAVLVIVVDRYTKSWVLAHLFAHEPLVVFPFFNLTLAYNTGAAFSFLQSAAGWQTFVFTSLAIVVSVGILVWLARTPSRDRWEGIALSLILGGALGNAWDRLIYGHVVDFLDFHWESWHFATFNVADSAICVGAVMLVGYWIRKK